MGRRESAKRQRELARESAQSNPLLFIRLVEIINVYIQLTYGVFKTPDICSYFRELLLSSKTTDAYIINNFACIINVWGYTEIFPKKIQCNK